MRRLLRGNWLDLWLLIANTGICECDMPYLGEPWLSLIVRGLCFTLRLVVIVNQLPTSAFTVVLIN